MRRIGATGRAFSTCAVGSGSAGGGVGNGAGTDGGVTARGTSSGLGVGIDLGAINERRCSFSDCAGTSSITVG